jgi:hypothetical protein
MQCQRPKLPILRTDGRKPRPRPVEQVGGDIGAEGGGLGTEVRWVGIDALREEIDAEPERFTPWLRIYMAEHGSQIFGAAA